MEESGYSRLTDRLNSGAELLAAVLALAALLQTYRSRGIVGAELRQKAKLLPETSHKVWANFRGQDHDKARLCLKSTHWVREVNTSLYATRLKWSSMVTLCLVIMLDVGEIG